MKSIDYYLKITYNLLIAKQKRNVWKCIKKEGFYMRKRNITGLLFAAALVMAGSQMGVLESQARPHHGDDWEDRWEDRWDDDRWDDDDDDDDDDHHWGGGNHHHGGNGGNDDGEHRPAVGGFVNVVYFCEEDNTVWANGEIWAAGLADGKGNVNSSELTNVPEGYKLKEVGDFYYDGGAELRIQVVPNVVKGGMVNVVYECKEENHVWANGEIWAAGLVNGKGNVNSSELTNVPEGYKLKEVGDFYYDGGAELRIQVVPEETRGGYVNIVYYCEATNHVWANGEIWAAGLVNGKGNVNSSELTNVPEGYKLKEVGDFYYDGGAELRIPVIQWYR